MNAYAVILSGDELKNCSYVRVAQVNGLLVIECLFYGHYILIIWTSYNGMWQCAGGNLL